MQLHGYGEDALTLLALTSRLPEFLSALHDPSDLSQAIVLYRPSFGRSGKASPFGEFDGIVGTPAAVYLIESKWSRSAEAWQPRMDLRPEQLRRHQIFRWYLERWRQANPRDWNTFADALAREQFASAFSGKGMPPTESILAQSLEYTLSLLAHCGPVRNVLLYCDIDGRPCPTNAAGFGFTRVCMHFPDATLSGFFAMDLHGQPSPPAT
jgi:hypothetical protein